MLKGSFVALVTPMTSAGEVGWDALGLPAENDAIKKGIHPEINTRKNIENFKRQLIEMSPMFDWSREIDTTDPEYYKWTQWIFLQMFNFLSTLKFK